MIRIPNNHDVKLSYASISFNTLLMDFIGRKVYEKQNPFDERYTNVSNEIISNYIYKFQDFFQTNVAYWRPWYVFTKAYASTYSGNYELIRINSRKLDRSWQSIAGTLAHEWGHCLEYYINKCYNYNAVFNHGDNSPIDKENTFQYWLGSIVETELNKFETFQDFLTACINGEYNASII